MPVPSWLTSHLETARVQYQIHGHHPAYTAEAVARLEHVAGIRFGKVVVAIADGKPVLLVMPSYAHVDPARARFLLHAFELRLATEAEIVSLLPGASVGATPPLRHWSGVEIWMDPLLRHEGPFVFQAGTHEHTVEIDFADWLRIAHPKVGAFVEPTFIGA